MANIIAILIITGWVCATIAFIIKDWRKSKIEGTPMACFSCSSHANGTCNHHCPSEKDVDAMIQAAKKRLQTV